LVKRHKAYDEAMRQFGTVERFIRHHFLIYRFVRGIAPTICRWIPLEDGFDFLSRVEPHPGFAAIDVGANDGTSIRMIHKFNPEVEIVSFDPITKPKFRLKRVTFYSLALGKIRERVNLYSPIVNDQMLSQYSSFNKDQMLNQVAFDLNIKKNQISTRSTVVEVHTLDDYQIRCYFLKIDVEGGELPVILGGLTTIVKNRPIILVELQDENSYNQMRIILEKLDYINVNPQNFEPDKFLSKKIQSNFSAKTNNYVWISLDEQISWKFKS
jgi:FkbM family methyltransferase